MFIKSLKLRPITSRFSISAIAAVLLVSFFSCKNQSKEENPLGIPWRQSSLKADTLSICLKVKVTNDDRFQLFYIESEEQQEFSDMRRLYIDLKAGDNFQDVCFKLPTFAPPFAFRIDIGERRNEEPIQLKKMIISLDDRQITIDQFNSHRYFEPNIYAVAINGESYLRQTVDEKYDPFIVSSKFLIKKIELELYR